jgi:ribonuclease PH
VALCDAVRFGLRQKWLSKSPVVESVAAVSVGMVKGKALLDLDYVEDVAADVDMNVVMTGAGAFIEVQGTGEGATFERQELDRLVTLATRGIRQLTEMQTRALRRRMPAKK